MSGSALRAKISLRSVFSVVAWQNEPVETPNRKVQLMHRRARHDARQNLCGNGCRGSSTVRRQGVCKQKASARRLDYTIYFFIAVANTPKMFISKQASVRCIFLSFSSLDRMSGRFLQQDCKTKNNLKAGVTSDIRIRRYTDI